MGTFTDGLKRVDKAIAAGVEEANKQAQIEREKRMAIEAKLKTEVTLNVDSLKELRRMSTWQLQEIFRGKTVHLADRPLVYKELARFSTWQLSAIFGENKED